MSTDPNSVNHSEIGARSKQRLSIGQFLILILAGLISYAISALAHWPASHAWSLARPALAHVALAKPEGSIWRGRGHARMYDIDLGRMEWRVLGRRLLTGQVVVEIDLHFPNGEGSGTGTATLRPDGVEFQPFTASIPAATALTHPVVSAISPGGTVKVDLDALTLSANGQAKAAAGQITWEGATLDLGRPVPLGDIHATFSTDDQGIHAAINDAGGPLLISGSLSLSPEGHYRFEGIMGTRPTAATELISAMQLLGPDNDSGQYPLDLEGTL